MSKLRKLLDAKGIAYEKKELKAALAAKLKDAMRKEKEEEDSDEEDFDEYEDDGSVEWMLRMHQKIARPKNKRDWRIRESVLTGGGIPDNEERKHQIRVLAKRHERHAQKER